MEDLQKNQALKQDVAEAMRARTKLPIYESSIVKIENDADMNIFAAQMGSTTVLCWRLYGGHFLVKTVKW